MADEDIKRLLYPDGGLVCWVPKYAKRDLPKDAAKRAVVVGLLDCQLSEPAPEYAGKLRNMTGRYESESSVCCVNQAGKYIEIWWSGLTDNRELHRYSGVCKDEATGLFALYEIGDPSIYDGGGKAVGWLASINALEFRIDWTEGTEGKYRRISSRATLSDRAVARLAPLGKKHPLIAGWLESEHRPLAHAMLDRLLRYLKSPDFAKRLQRLFSLEVGGGNLNTDDVYNAIEAIVRGIQRSPKGAFPDSDMHRVAAQVLPVLLEWKLLLLSSEGIKENRTLYDWLQRVLYYNKNFTPAPADVFVIRQWLGVPEPEEHFYQITAALRVSGLDASLPFAEKAGKAVKKAQQYGKKAAGRVVQKIKEVGGKWAEKLDEEKVKKIVGDKIADKIDKLLQAHAGVKILEGAITIAPADNSWVSTYFITAVVAAAGTGGGQRGVERLDAKGYCTTGVAWKPEAFTGMFTFLPGILATDSSGTREKKQMIWLLDGKGTAPQTMLVFDEVDTKASDMDIGWGEGMIMDLDPDNVERWIIPDAPMFDYALEYKQDANVHFQLGSATVRDPARWLIRIFAANELALLRDPYSRVAVEGFADRIGQRWYNQKLSESRASNVRQALEDCLGSDLKATVETHGYGEDVLMALGESFGFPDGGANEQWRRVFVVMNTQVAATMGTSDSSKKRKPKGK